MQLVLIDELPFVTIKATYRGQEIEIPNILLDTGSASTILSADIVAHIGIIPEADDLLRVMRGVGGTEVVFTRIIERIQVDTKFVTQYEIEVGGLDYGFALNGILGMDFLTAVGAIINLDKLELEFSE